MYGNAYHLQASQQADSSTVLYLLHGPARDIIAHDITGGSDGLHVLSCRLNNPTVTLFGFGDNNAQTSLIMTLASPQVSSDGEVPSPAILSPQISV